MQNKTNSIGDTIVLVHGFGANRLVMLPMMWRLERLGYKVINLGYFSLASIEKTYSKVVDCLRQVDEKPDTRQVHVVAHSMGCILVRKALSEFRPSRLGRVVMMTPPSKGTPRADLFAPVLGRLVRPLSELRTSEDSFVNQLPLPDYRFGLTRATHDLLIPPSYESLPGAESELLVRGIHSQILISKTAIDKVAGYLETGVFQS